MLEDNYKIFISYKNTVNGCETEDSKMAKELYEILVKQGYKTFYSKESLAQMGTDRYKDMIDQVLDQCVILIVVGTSVDNIQSKWVKYEWDSFYTDILNDTKNAKVFSYVDNINPHDLPRTLRNLQCFEKKSTTVDEIVSYISNAMSSLEGDTHGISMSVKEKLVSLDKDELVYSENAAAMSEPNAVELLQDPENLTGKIIADRYNILEVIGKGDVAYVYKAKDLKKNQIIAFKVLRTEFCEDKESIDCFIRNANMVKELKHPNVVEIFDIGQSGKIYFVTMELMNPRSLYERIVEANEEGKDAFTEEEIITIIAQIARGIQAAHEKGIVHGNLVSSNIMKTYNGVVKVADFGIIRSERLDFDEKYFDFYSKTDVNGGQIDRRGDIFSLGMILYEMLFRPYADKGKKLGTVGEELGFCYMRCSKYSERYRNVTEFISDLEAIYNRRMKYRDKKKLPRILRNWIKK